MVNGIANMPDSTGSNRCTSVRDRAIRNPMPMPAMTASA